MKHLPSATQIAPYRPCEQQGLVHCITPMLSRHLRLLWLRQREVSTAQMCGSSPEPGPNWRTMHVSPVVCRGLPEGTNMFLGRRKRANSSLQSLLTTKLTGAVRRPVQRVLGILLYEATGRILVQDACQQCLIRDALRERPLLQCLKILA
jgi:hypothetical protein